MIWSYATVSLLKLTSLFSLFLKESGTREFTSHISSPSVVNFNANLGKLLRKTVRFEYYLKFKMCNPATPFIHTTLPAEIIFKEFCEECHERIPLRDIREYSTSFS